MSFEKSKEITKLYLYGTDTTPTNLVDESLIRPADAESTVTIDVADFMKNGGGRFALGPQFSIIQKFFKPDSSTPEVDPAAVL